MTRTRAPSLSNCRMQSGRAVAVTESRSTRTEGRSRGVSMCIAWLPTVQQRPVVAADHIPGEFPLCQATSIFSHSSQLSLCLVREEAYGFRQRFRLRAAYRSAVVLSHQMRSFVDVTDDQRPSDGEVFGELRGQCHFKCSVPATRDDECMRAHQVSRQFMAWQSIHQLHVTTEASSDG